MLNTPPDILALLFDLRRRVEQLEKGLHGYSAPEGRLPLLTRCYREAHRAIHALTEENAGIWIAQAYLWDARAYVELGRHVNDPYPYRPFLAVLDTCVLKGIQGAKSAQGHLEAVGQDVLAAQGLELVRPRDTMGTLRLLEALERLSRGR